MPKAFWLLMYSAAFFLLVLPSVAVDLGDRTDDPEVGLGIDKPPVKKDKIPEVAFQVQSGKPEIDGILDDAFWKDAQKFSLDMELYPSRLAPAPVKTEGMIGLTTTHLYVALVAHDDNPSRFRSARKERDSTREDDYVSIIIDPSGQGTKKLEFRVNPHGTISDIFQDTVTDRYLYDWDTEWEAAAKIEAPGYKVEMAIPYSSLKFAGLKFGAKPGIAALKRSYPRRVDTVTGYFFRYRIDPPESHVAVDFGPLSLSRDLNLEYRENFLGARFHDHSPFRFTPHVIYHFDEERPVGGDWERVPDHDLVSAGFDLRYQPKRNKALTLTVNPNFVEVEVDLVRDSINNPFVPFQPEKRRFFQEVAEVWHQCLGCRLLACWGQCSGFCHTDRAVCM